MFNELHFVPVKGPTNVYSLAVVDVLGDPLVLVATRTGSVVRVALWDFSWGKEETVPFLYVPGDAEIVAIDAYCTDAQGIVVAITFMKVVPSLTPPLLTPVRRRRSANANRSSTFTA